MKKQTQIGAILNEFKKGKTLNLLTAFKLTGSMRLPAKVFELQEQGYRFKKTSVNFKTRYGTRGAYVNYKLIK